MKKAILDGDHGYFGEVAETIGFVPNYMWRSIKYFAGPKKHGKYLTINKYGRITPLYCTGMSGIYRVPFEMAVNASNAFKDDNPMTDSDLIGLYRYPWGIWYTFGEDDAEDETVITVITKASPRYPLYFLDLNLEDGIHLDKDGEIITDDDPQPYILNNEGDYIEKEEDSNG